MRVCRDARNGTAEHEVAGLDVDRPTVYLRASVAAGGRCHFSYSLDNQRFLALGETFTARPGHWVGAKVGLFAVAAPGATRLGHADVDWFRVTAP
jgi:hypothetical protein